MPEAPWVGDYYEKYRNRYYGLTDEPMEEEEVEDKFEKVREAVCDLCKWPSEFKDSDELWRKKCDKCKVMELLEEIENGNV